MSNKFGWQKANAKDAARKALLAGSKPKPSGRRKKSRKHKAKIQRKYDLPRTYTRYACRQCGSLNTTLVVGHGLRCESCGHLADSGNPVLFKRQGRTVTRLG